LLDSPNAKKPLKVSDEDMSLLLQIGVVPPPKTNYKNFYIVGLGDKAGVVGNVTIQHQKRHYRTYSV
jgi:asparagine synthase (glutamine-hydrolysing)